MFCMYAAYIYRSVLLVFIQKIGYITIISVFWVLGSGSYGEGLWAHTEKGSDHYTAIATASLSYSLAKAKCN